MINHSKYQDMLVCQKTTNLFIIFACGLVLLVCDCLFSYNTCSRNISVFVWVCGLSVKRSKQGSIYLICQETLILQKRGVHIYMQVGKLLFFLSTWHFEIFLYNLSLIFLPILQNPCYLGMFWKFPCPSQVGYQDISAIKGRTSKVAAEDGKVCT